MATDVEESDMDDHERPAPPKRQCTKLADPMEPSYNSSTNKRLEESVQSSEKSEESQYDEVERLAREKLNIWQECQVAKGFLDNTINCVIEDYILNPPVTYPTIEDLHFRLFRGTEMEDTAMMMAIRNHGLVHPGETEQRMPSNVVHPSFANRHCSNSENSEFSNFPASDRLSMVAPDEDENLASSSTRSIEIDARRVEASYWNKDAMNESDQEQDFWERAVAEAIKKKGLSALSVDYG